MGCWSCGLDPAHIRNVCFLRGHQTSTPYKTHYSQYLYINIQKVYHSLIRSEYCVLLFINNITPSPTPPPQKKNQSKHHRNRGRIDTLIHYRSFSWFDIGTLITSDRHNQFHGPKPHYLVKSCGYISVLLHANKMTIFAHIIKNAIILYIIHR